MPSHFPSSPITHQQKQNPAETKQKQKRNKTEIREQKLFQRAKTPRRDWANRDQQKQNNQKK
jgi:hypothetical protein